MDASEDRINSVLVKKEEITMSEMKRKMFLLNKWDILKVKVSECQFKLLER